MKNKIKKLPYIDSECIVGERVMWTNIAGERFEGVLEDWDNYNAIIKMDDGTTKIVQC